ncbi:hypothetical protein [Streptomyces sp. NPDC015125]|uniref:hypothetical protein n=1 Tax=Streptomyces sp. NPDC015125 TaxID=3364938 RepID=UPI0036F761CD
MRTISILRWVNGLRALTPGLTVTAPVSARSCTTLTTPAPGREHAAPAPDDRARSLDVPDRQGSSPVRGTAPTTGNGTVPTATRGVAGHAAGPVGDLRTRTRPAVAADAAVRDGAPHAAPGPAGAPLPGFRHEAQQAR